MNLARWSAFLLLPVVLLLERFAYYGMRSVLYTDLMGAGAMDAAAMGTHVRYITWMIALSPPLGGLLAFVLLPRWTLVAGLAVTAAGYALVAMLGSASLAAFSVLAIGLGLVRPAIFATAALAVRDPDESARAALFVGMYLAVNAGSFAGSIVSGALPQTGEVGPFVIITIAGAVFVALALLLAAGVALAPRYGDVADPPDPPLTGEAKSDLSP